MPLGQRGIHPEISGVGARSDLIYDPHTLFLATIVLTYPLH